MINDDTQSRLAAHRLAFFALATVMDEAKPGAFENVITVLTGLENEARRRDEPIAYVEELQLLLSGLRSQHGDPEWDHGTPLMTSLEP